MTDDPNVRWRDHLPWRTPKAAWRTLPKPPEDDARTLEWTELAAQFAWFDRRAYGNGHTYFFIKALTLLLGGAVTVLAALHSPAALTASLAATIVAAEGIQHLFNMQKVWLDYQRTALALRRLAMSYVMHEKPYGTENKDRLKDLHNETQRILDEEASNWLGVVSREEPGGDSGS